MLSAQRRKEIFRILNSEGQVHLSDLASRFNVSIMTIRRDLEWLEQEGKARRVHGGAILTEQKWNTDTIETKSVTNVDKKQSIANSCMRLLHPCSSIFLDAGSTTLEIAKLMCTELHKELTICTTDLHIADLLCKQERFHVYFCGGKVDGSTSSVGGQFAVQMIRALHADLAIIGCDGLTIKDGAMGTRMEQAGVKQAMIEHSLQSALVADSTKFGRVSFVTIAPLTAFDYVVSDSNLSEDMQHLVTKSGTKVITN
jgi:DeoR/GlpR family transcriptional regulator of sugar metabolism